MGKRVAKLPFNFYTVIKGDKRQVVHSWAECEKLTKGVKGGIRFKGFHNRQEADEWEPSSTIPAKIQPSGSKQRNVNDYIGDFVAKRQDAVTRNMAIFFTDASCMPAIKFSGLGVYSPSLQTQTHQKLEFNSHTNQRGEILGIDVCLQQYEERSAEYPGGVCIFTDSRWSRDMVLTWPAGWEARKRAHDTNFPDAPWTEWRSADNKPVKHQDIVVSILGRMARLREQNREVFIHWIPRELNQEADSLSRGKMLVAVDGVLRLTASM